MKKIEFAKELKDLYSATSQIEEVTAERGVFLGVDGQGEPGGEAFQIAFEQLYPLAYTLRFSLKTAGALDFTVSKPECLWFVDDPKNTPLSDWGWRLLIRIPEEVTNAQLKDARKTIREKKDLDTSAVKRRSWREGRALQVLHVGPYEKLEETYKRLCAHAQELGYKIKQPGHEIYLSDPRRTAPEKIKTIVRLPVAHPRPGYARGKKPQ